MTAHQIIATRPSLVVPAYFHPAVRPADWQRLADRARQVRLVVLNIANGVGDRTDEAFLPVLAELRKRGVRIAAYVDTAYGRRPVGSAMVELQRYQAWYGVGDVFFDQVSTSVDMVEHYRAVAGAARRLGAELVAFNHGAQPAPAYAEHADLLGTFEGSWQAYLDAVVSRWVRESPAHRFFHLVHSVPQAHLGDALDLAAKRNAGGAYVTNHSGANPWDHLPGVPPDVEAVHHDQ